jgi:serine/threonine-protein kinase
VSDASFAHGLLGVTLDGRYRLDAVLGEGGMGSVFRATHLAMDRKVAVKLLKPHLTGDKIALERFSREARATLKVDSPHAVKVLDFGITPLGDYYMVLEYLDGRTVQRELEIDGPFAPPRVAHIARQALAALGAAHARGLIHRDVKPENLLLMRVGSDGDYTKILDFGVAKLMQGAGDPAQLALTAAGMVFGTPEFMSPEQACGLPLDGRSDLYSLAATMFVMLTGTTLFEGTTPIEWLTHHVRTPAPPLAMARPELAAYPELDALLQRCLAKQRELRPETAAEMARLLADLEPALARSPASAPPRTASRPGPIHPSGYVEVLRDPGSTLLPAVAPPPTAATPFAGPATESPSPLLRSVAGHGGRDSLASGARGIARAAADVDSPAATIATPDAAPRRSRRLALWLGGITVASVIGVAIGLSVAGSESPQPASAPASTGRPGASSAARVDERREATGGRDPAGFAGGAGGRAPRGIDPAAPAVSGAPGPPVVAVVTASGPAPVRASSSGAAAPGGTGGSASAASPSPAPAPAAPGPRPASPAHRPAHTVAPLDPEIADHLREAEDAYRNHLAPLRQLAAADTVLRAEPGNLRARFLAGDALIKSGDIDNGCKYLARAKPLAAARTRARAAGCPD